VITTHYQGRGETGMATSEVARLREQYELEYQAGKRALKDPAIVAPHVFITHRMEQMWEQVQHLEQAVGREEAKRIVFSLPLDLSEPQAHD
jgi:hypothetical protein